MGGTKTLDRWIEDMEKCGIFLCKDQGLVVITVVGKDPSSSSKLADLNEALGSSLEACGTYDSIEVVFSIDLGALFLMVTSYKDAPFDTLPSHQDFFNWIGMGDCQMESNLAVAFSLSHLVLFIENATRIELTLLHTLQNVNRKRMELRDTLDEESGPSRFAVPRFLFAFHRHLIRKDLGMVKRKELLEKLEQSLEDQTYNIFKQYRLLSSGGETAADDALGHIWGEGYVHLMEKTNDVNADHFLAKLISTMDEGEEREENEPQQNRLFSFLSLHVKKVREGKKLVYEIPSNARFLSRAKKLMKGAESLYEEGVEEEFIKKLSAMHLEKAKEKYMPLGTGRVFSRTEHEERMASVLESLSSIQPSPLDVSALREEFESIWSSDLRSCEYRSLYGNACRLAAHAGVGDGVEREKWSLHSSSVTHISACNCGRSQLRRSDPFTVKEANCDFYSQFSCCERSMEMHQFKVVADEAGRALDVVDEEWPEARVVGQMGEREEEEKREEKEEEGEGAGEGSQEEEEEDEERLEGSSEEDERTDDRSYLDSGELVVKTAKDVQLAKAIQDYDALSRLRSDGVSFIEGVPTVDTPGLRPFFPSWSLVCVGTSSLYSHNSGIRGQFGFIGDTHLLPLDVYLEVDSTAWFRDMAYVESVIKSSNASNRGKRMRKGMISERVKLFIGMEYECSAGHRQLEVGPMNDGIHLVENDLPLYQPCSYRKTPCQNAQLMRIHIVTPKAPVTVSINPKIIPSNSTSVFYPGESLDLSWSRYYILRLPWIYAGPDGIIPPPEKPGHSGLLLANSISVSYSPLSNW